MNDDDTKRILRELRAIRTCAVVSATVFVLAFVAYILRFHL
jgi:hypothetical protein